jgi:hypothetical protein
MYGIFHLYRCLRLNLPVRLTAKTQYKIHLVQLNTKLKEKAQEAELAVASRNGVWTHKATNIIFHSDQKKTGEVFGLLIGELNDEDK